MTGETKSATFGYDAAAVASWVSSVDPSAKCVYESGVTGFDLQKKLAALGVGCVVGAVSKMIKPSADRKRKNDRNDAGVPRPHAVGGQRRGGVGPRRRVRGGARPDPREDLVRALDDAREDLKALQAAAVEVPPQAWARLQRDHPAGAQEGQLDRGPLGVDKVDIVRRGGIRPTTTCSRTTSTPSGRRPRKGPARRGWSRPEASWCPDGNEGSTRQVPEGRRHHDGRRPGLRGRRVLRFKNARSFAAWLGLTPSQEHSSGENNCVRQGGITKAGNKHLRRVLVESAWHYMKRSPLGPRQRTDSGPCGEERHAPKGVDQAGPAARGHAGPRGPSEQGQRRHRPRARMLVLGDLRAAWSRRRR